MEVNFNVFLTYRNQILTIFASPTSQNPVMTLHTSAVTPAKVENDRRILELLSQTFPDISAASTEIINLEAILNLPKGTEHFVADLHGEH